MDKKILIVSGDSFTFEKWNWPGYLKDNINYDINNSGMGCQGNGLISKKIIYNVDKVLKTISADDILVGVMWSAIDRTEFYLDDVSNYNNVDGWVENPTNIVDGVENKRWFITNSHWKTPKAKMWYEYFHTDIESMISFMYDVLSVQWYLEKHNIKYFMSTIIDIFENREQTINHPEIKYLYDMINFEYFLPITLRL